MKPTLLLLPLLAALLLAACGSPSEPRAEADGSGPAGPPGTATVVGSIIVPEGAEAFGVLVFAEGLSYAAYTDALGSFRISGLPPGEYQLRAMRPDLLSEAVAELRVSVRDADGPQPFLQLDPVAMSRRVQEPMTTDALRLQLGGIIGRVSPLDPDDREGVSVELVGAGLNATTDAQGRFAFRNVVPGTYSLRFRRPGYLLVEQPVTVEAARTAELEATRLDFAPGFRGGGEEDFAGVAAPATARTIFGVVLFYDADGSPLEGVGGAEVAARGTSISATPDDIGGFILTGLSGRPYTIIARAPGFTLLEPVDVDLSDLSAAEVVLELQADAAPTLGEGALSGFVVLSDRRAGQSMAGVMVGLAGTNFVSTSDFAGNFSIVGIVPGTYDLIASRAGYEPFELAGLEIGADELVEIGPITLEPEVDPPFVVSTSPADGESDLTVRQPTTITIQFSEAMDPATLADAVRFSPAVDFTIAAAGQHPQASDNRLVLQLPAQSARSGAAPLRFGQQYTMTVGRQAANLQGVPMAEDFTMRFRTGQAKIIATSPADGAEGVFINPGSPIRVSFNAPITTQGLRPEDIRIRPQLSMQPQLNATQDPRTGWSVLSISGTFDAGTTYTVSIRTTRLRTISGDRITNIPYTFSFTTSEPRELMPGMSGGQRRR